MTPLDTLKLLRPNYPTPMSREDNGKLLNLVCLAHPTFAMYAKPNGNNCVLPNGVAISRDILIDRMNLDAYDCLIGSEAEGTPTWNKLGSDVHQTDPSRIVLPVSVQPEPGPTPTPTPTPGPTPPPAVDLSPVLQRIDKLDGRLAETLHIALNRLDALEAAVNADRTLTGRQSGWAGGNVTGTIKKG